MINNDMHIFKYKTDDMKQCDYITLMSTVYCKPPKQENGKCAGYRNKYRSELVSHVCEHCINFDNSLGGQEYGSM